MKIVFFTIFLLLISGLNIIAQTSVTKEEYTVYAAVLKKIYIDILNESKTRSSFVIVDTTHKPDTISDWKIKRIRGLSGSFERKNQVPVKLDKSFPVKYQYEITTKNEIDTLLQTGSREFEESQKKSKYPLPGGEDVVWKPFHSKYPNSYGYYQFSRIGFSSGKEFAVVYVQHSASESGSWTNYILRKKKKLWTIYLSYGGNWIA